LLRLAERGFGVWPFFDGWPRVIEIYPRALTGPVRKSSWADRHEFLFRRFPAEPAELLERAAGSEDAFDAAVSALVMGAHRRSFESLTQTSDPDYSIEGRIWRPSELS
jgi:predicted nuclease with RNAse H fold